MKKKDEIDGKVKQLEKTEKSIAKKNKVKMGTGQRGAIIAVTIVLCAAAVVGGYYLVQSLTGANIADQTSNAPSDELDPDILPEKPENPVSYPASSTAVRDSGAIDSGEEGEPTEVPAGFEADNIGAEGDIILSDSDFAVTISPVDGEENDEPDMTSSAPADTTASTRRTRGTDASSGTTTEDYEWDTPELEHDPESFEGQIGDFFN